MYQVIKRDGKINDFDISKISHAIKAAFDAQGKNYNNSVIDFIALTVTADFESKIKDDLISVEETSITSPLIMIIFAPYLTR